MKRGLAIFLTDATGAVVVLGLIGVALAVVASLIVHSANAATDLMTETVGEQRASKTMNTNTTSNSNAVLGSLFSIGEDKLTSFNPINKTYTKVSYVGNRTIIPPGAATTATINATERGNLTLISNRMVLVLLKGKAFL